MIPSLLRLSCVIIVITITLFTWSPLLTTTAQQQQQQQQTPTTTTGGTGASATTTTTPLTPSPPLTPQEQNQQIRLQNVIASTTLNLQETQKQIGGVVFTPRWSQPVWVNANSVAVLLAYCLPGEFADSGQEILGGFGLEILESYGVALPQGFMAWMAVVGNEDIQNRRLPAALGVMCASDLNRPETRVLSPEKQQEINNINQQFVNIQNTQITDIDNVINVINTITTTAVTPPPAGQNATGGTGAGTAILPASQDTTPPTFIGIEDIVTEPTSEQSGRVTYAVTAQDNVDGTAKLEADGITVTQDNVGGNIAISCDIASGSEFLSGETPVPCVATDQAGNAFRDSFGIIVTPGSNGTINGTTGGAGTTALAAAPVQDTTPPTLSSPENMVVESTSAEGAVVRYTVTAQDNVDGTATLDENNILIQDNADVYANMDGAPPMSGGDGSAMSPAIGSSVGVPSTGGDRTLGGMKIVCNPPSGSTFPIGEEWVIKCEVIDSVGNIIVNNYRGTCQSSAPPLNQGEIIPPLNQQMVNVQCNLTLNARTVSEELESEPSSTEPPLEIPPSEAPPVIIDEEPSSPQAPPSLQAPPVIIDEEPSGEQPSEEEEEEEEEEEDMTNEQSEQNGQANTPETGDNTATTTQTGDGGEGETSDD